MRTVPLAGKDDNGSVLATVADLACGLGDASEAGRHDRVRGEWSTRRVDGHVVAEAERLHEQWFLVGERALELGHLDRGLLQPRRLACERGGR